MKKLVKPQILSKTGANIRAAGIYFYQFCQKGLAGATYCRGLHPPVPTLDLWTKAKFLVWFDRDRFIG
ncbi:hypothetical protein [Chroococcidiopsis sp.]|uniref:hypothetical protein n=1 Tax=Chroococcidiopsis sp. TaxID=3088168 RepID=UPI003F322C1B